MFPALEYVMRIFADTIQYLLELESIRQWPELGLALTGAAEQEPGEWRLPVIACEAVGGHPTDATAVVAAIALLQAGIILIDDMLDADPRGRHIQIGMSAAANMASALQAISQEAICHTDLDSARKVAIINSLGQMMSRTALGQHLDVQNPQDEAGYWRVVATKSTPFFASVLYAGAVAGGAEDAVTQQIWQFGILYGEMIQIHDDLTDTLSTPAGPDWLMGRSPLPVFFALTVPHPDREKFAQLRYQVRNAEALQAAQEILVRCGAISYAVDQIVQRHKQAQQLIETVPLVESENLSHLLTELIDPVIHLVYSMNETERSFAHIELAHSAE
jgi:octaprenyl-diphosphate synthase